MLLNYFRDPKAKIGMEIESNPNTSQISEAPAKKPWIEK
jgi:hypothetical protein